MNFLPNEQHEKNNMFTGIVQTVGLVTGLIEKKERAYISLKPKNKIGHIRVGDSVSISGVCLTLVKKLKFDLMFEVMPETKRKTTLVKLKKNDHFNLELALRVGDRLGGHMVQGHVDALASVVFVEFDGKTTLVGVKLPAKLKKYVILHGSITFDGISLTVARLQGNLVTVSLIKETMARTTWKNIAVGQLVNVEVDVIGKYVEKFLKK